MTKQTATSLAPSAPEIRVPLARPRQVRDLQGGCGPTFRARGWGMASSVARTTRRPKIPELQRLEACGVLRRWRR